MNDQVKILKQRKPTKKSVIRVDQILRRQYGNVVGTGQTELCLQELVRDIKHFCVFTGKDFKKIVDNS